VIPGFGGTAGGPGAAKAPPHGPESESSRTGRRPERRATKDSWRLGSMGQEATPMGCGAERPVGLALLSVHFGRRTGDRGLLPTPTSEPELPRSPISLRAMSTAAILRRPISTPQEHAQTGPLRPFRPSACRTRPGHVLRLPKKRKTESDFGLHPARLRDPRQDHPTPEARRLRPANPAVPGGDLLSPAGLASLRAGLWALPPGRARRRMTAMPSPTRAAWPAGSRSFRGASPPGEESATHGLTGCGKRAALLS
jgi:hypothetical protein